MPTPSGWERAGDSESQPFVVGGRVTVVVLTVGERVMIRSLSKPEKTCEIEWFQGAAVPACFGKYEYVNMREGFCTVVLLRWKKG